MQHKPESILDAAITVFLEHGVNASTAKVAAVAGVSNGTLFNYFPTKQDLIDRLYVSIKQQMADAVGAIDRNQPLSGQVRIIWDRWIAWARANRDAHLVMNLLHQSGMASESAQIEGLQALSSTAKIMDEAEQAGLFANLPRDYLSALIQLHLDLAITAELDDEQVALAYDVLWNGISR